MGTTSISIGGTRRDAGSPPVDAGTPMASGARSDAGSGLTPLSGQKLPRRPENWPIRIVRGFSVRRHFACKMLRSTRPQAELAKILAEAGCTGGAQPHPLH